MNNYLYNDGVKNEYDFVNCLNNKEVKDLNPLFYMMIKDLYKDIKNSDIIKCYKNENLEKTDIYIEINGIKKEISIKMGVKNSVHVEGISSFIHFLIQNNVDRDSVIAYLKYHYADGTISGKGIKRLSAKEYKMNNQDEIDQINMQFCSEKLLVEATKRFVLKGRNNFSNVDLIIHGTVNDFLWITKEDVVKKILSKKADYSSAVHFGPLTCQPMDRCLNYNSRYEKKRFCVQIKWYNLVDDIIENMNDNVIAKSKQVL